MAKDSQEDAERLTYLQRADTIVVLVDGERLANTAHRTSAQADAADILESLLDANMVSPSCQVEIVFSKLDRITAAGQPALDFLGKAKEKFEGKFRARVSRLSFRNIAARPASSEQESSERRPRGGVRVVDDSAAASSMATAGAPLRPASDGSSASSAGDTSSGQEEPVSNPANLLFIGLARFGEDHLLGSPVARALRQKQCDDAQADEAQRRSDLPQSDHEGVARVLAGAAHEPAERTGRGPSPRRRRLRLVRPLDPGLGGRSVRAATEDRKMKPPPRRLRTGGDRRDAVPPPGREEGHAAHERHQLEASSDGQQKGAGQRSQRRAEHLVPRDAPRRRRSSWSCSSFSSNARKESCASPWWCPRGTSLRPRQPARVVVSGARCFSSSWRRTTTCRAHCLRGECPRRRHHRARSEKQTLLELDDALKRIKVRQGQDSGQDITKPIAWLLGGG